jgi:hypothetical protein
MCCGIPVRMRCAGASLKGIADVLRTAQPGYDDDLPQTTEVCARRTLGMEQALRWLALRPGR